jgi:hypothetical protein
MIRERALKTLLVLADCSLWPAFNPIVMYLRGQDQAQRVSASSVGLLVQDSGRGHLSQSSSTPTARSIYL